MSNSKVDSDLHEVEDDNISILENAPIPQGGYGLVFSEAMAQEISEFTTTELFKKLKAIYGLQKKDRIARQCLNSAHNTEWLHYFKGMAAAVELFFNDMEKTAEAFKKAHDDEIKKSGESQYKK